MRHRSFNEILSEKLNLSDRAAAAVKRRHEEEPFSSRGEIRGAFLEELRILSTGEFTEDDHWELAQLGISV